METTYKYANLAERASKIKEAETIPLRMVRDNFDADWKIGTEPHGNLVFTDVLEVPDTAEVIAEKAKDTTYLSPILVAGLNAYKNWGSQTAAQKDGVLKGILGYLLRKAGVL